MSNIHLRVFKDLFGLGLNPLELLILAQVMEFQLNKAVCYMTDEQFAENFGVSAKTVGRHITSLEQKGFITRHNAGSKSRTLTYNKENIEKQLGQNVQENTDNLSKNHGQNDSLKDKEKKNIKDKKSVEETSVPDVSSPLESQKESRLAGCTDENGKFVF